MAKKATKRTTAKRSPTKATPKAAANRSSSIAAYFQTKLEAEWGPYDLKRALDANAQNIVVLDTRTPDAFKEERIPQAVNIQTSELEQRLSEIPKNKEVVSYCWNITCHLATKAALLLAQKGYRVHELAGGIDQWKASELPVAGTAAKEPALSTN